MHAPRKPTIGPPAMRLGRFPSAGDAWREGRPELTPDNVNRTCRVDVRCACAGMAPRPPTRLAVRCGADNEITRFLWSDVVDVSGDSGVVDGKLLDVPAGLLVGTRERCCYASLGLLVFSFRALLAFWFTGRLSL